MKHKPAIISAVFFFFIVSGRRRKKRSSACKEAIELGKKNSKVLKSGQAKVDESAALQEAIEKKLPSASASASYLRLSSANFDLKTKPTAAVPGSGDQPSVNQAMYGIVESVNAHFPGWKDQVWYRIAPFCKRLHSWMRHHKKTRWYKNTIEAFANLFKANTAIRLVKENLDQVTTSGKENWQTLEEWFAGKKRFDESAVANFKCGTGLAGCAKQSRYR